MPKADSYTFINKRFHRIIVTEDLGMISRHHRAVLGICDCGKTRQFNLSSLKSGRTKSCGCLRTQANKSQRNRATHNLTNHPLYQVWCSMKDRCYCVTEKAYAKYGGRGVRICDEWKDNFKSFYDWCISHGWEKGLQLDKDKLSEGGLGDLYSPDRCCFLTRKENMKYRSNSIMVEYNGEVKYLVEWCEALGLQYRLVIYRIRKGWSSKRAFETPCVMSKRNKNYKQVA